MIVAVDEIPRIGLEDLNDVAAPRSSEGGSKSETPFRLHTYSAPDLMAIPDPPEGDMLLGPLVMRGARTIIVGDTGHGKTTLALQLCAAILTGSEMLGFTGSGVDPVMFIDVEQGIRSIKRSLREAKLAEREEVLYVAQPDGLELDTNKTHRDELAALLFHVHPAVVVLDPYYKAHRGDANEERAVVDLMRYLDGLRAEYHFALILPAHPRKDPASSPVRKLTLHDVSGSGAAVRGAEVILGLERLSHGYARLRILKDRDGDLPVGETWPLVFERGEGFKLDPKETQSAELIEEQILADESGEWRTAKEWSVEVGAREVKVRKILNSLVETGAVSLQIGPSGRSAKAKCYAPSSTAPGLADKSGSVTQSAMGGGTYPTDPDISLRDMSDRDQSLPGEEEREQSEFGDVEF